MSVQLAPLPIQRFFDNINNPLVAGKLYTYQAGTSTPQATYTDSTGITANSNPIVLNARGEASVWLTNGQLYKLVLKDFFGNTIWTVDQVSSAVSSAALINGSTGASLIGFDGTTLDQQFLSRVNRVVDSIAALRTLSHLTYTRAFVTGYYAPHDGGGGAYQYDPSDATSSDNGGTVIVASDGGRWKLSVIGNINPHQFGAKSDGTDAGVYLNNCLSWAMTQTSPVTMDLGGATFTTSQTVSYPATGYLRLQNGGLKANSSFTAGAFLVEAASQAGGLVNHDLWFTDLVLDGLHLASCLHLDNYIRVNIDKCRMLHYPATGYGLKLDKTIDSHEAIVTGCFAAEYLYGEGTPSATSVGVQVNSFDNMIDDLVSYQSGYGLVINAQYNQVARAHLGGTYVSLYVTQNAASSSFSQCYFDSSSVLIENPWLTEFIGNKFLVNTSTTSFPFIILKPLAANQFINGLIIEGNSFNNTGSATVNSIYVDTSVGSFSPSHVLSSHIGENSFNNCNGSYTRLRTLLYQTGATVWTFNLAAYLPIGQVAYANCSINSSTATITGTVTSIVGNVVTVTTSASFTGNVMIDVDVNFPEPI